MTGSPAEPEAVAPPGYVLVPVPEELVERVGTEIMRLEFTSRGVAQPWPVDDIVSLLVGSDDQITGLVRIVARAELDQRLLLDGEVAEHLGVSTRELAGIVHDINDHAPPGALDLIVLQRSEHGGALVREVRMSTEHARRVEEAVPVARRRRRRAQ